MKVTASDLSEAGVIAIVRASGVEVGELVEAAKALYRGGVRAMEVTLNTPGALTAIGRIREEVEGVWCGAGTVVCADDAVEAIGAGARFVVTPVVDAETIRACAGRGVPVISGCVSANEAVAAHGAGAELVKVFPASR
jgi:2-dehydro-3-deoxyphosphogluconate aldolase/(4S)-4-hydroxy-2-oxoglutarate aldolase